MDMTDENSPASAFKRYQDVRFFGSLNGLRFLSIVAVIWHHSPALASLENPIQLLKRGFVGVDFFFVLSGFLITTLLLREEARNGRFSIGGFYRRRILRIVPVYFLVITAVSIYYVFVKGEAQYGELVPFYYLFLSNFLIDDIPLMTITWSLSVEEQYYLIWPALLLVMPILGAMRFRVLVALIAICVAAAAGFFAQFGLQPIETRLAIWQLPATSYSAILIGSLTAMVLHNQRGYVFLYRICGHRFAPPVFFAALLVVLNETPGILSGWPNLLMHSTMALCLTSIVIREDNLFRPGLSLRPVTRIGEISYGLYLYHLIGLHFANIAIKRIGLGEGLEAWVVTVVFVVISVIIAEISFRTFERYFIGLKNRRPAAKGVTRPSGS